jgi:hypothetical protein
VAAAGLGVGGVQGDVGRPGAQDGEHHRDGLVAAGQEDADPVAGAHAAGGEPGRVGLDAGVQVTVGPAAVGELHGDGVRPLFDDAADQRVDVRVGDGVVGGVEVIEGGAGARPDALESGDGGVRFADQLAGESGDVFGERLRGGGLDAGGVVLEASAQPAVALVQLQGEQPEARGGHVLAPVGAQAAAQGDAVGRGGGGVGPAVQDEGAVERGVGAGAGGEFGDARERQPRVVDGARQFPLDAGDEAGGGQVLVLGGGAHQEGAHEVADGAVVARVGAGAERHADGGRGLPAVRAERLEVGGEQDGGGSGAVGAGERGDLAPQPGVQFQRYGRLAALLPGCGHIEGEVDGQVGAVEVFAPVRLGGGGVLLGLAGAFAHVGVEGGRGGAGDVSVLVGGEQVGEEQAGGLAVDDQVVDDEQQGVVVGAVAEEDGAQHAVAFQVEFLAGLGEQHVRVRAVGARGAPLQAGGAGRVDVEEGRAVAVVVVGDARGQHRVAGDEPAERGLERGRVERAAQIEGEGHVVRGGGGVGAVLEQQPQLLLGERCTACLVRPRSGGRGVLRAWGLELGHRVSPESDPRACRGRARARRGLHRPGTSVAGAADVPLTCG